MKNNRIFLALALTLACLMTISIITINTFSPETSVYCAGNVASANGSGHHKTHRLSFGAFDHGEGNVTGQATFIDDAARTKITIDVECVSVIGNIATIGGTVRNSTNPAFVHGVGVTFLVADNGEGANSPPDLFSLPVLGGCGGKLSKEPVLLPSNAGNIQVRFVAPDRDCTKCPFGTHCAGNGECVGGGGVNTCPPRYKECCGTCTPESEQCPEVCEIPGK